MNIMSYQSHEPASDYYMELKVQQGRMKSAMLKIGIKTIAELSRRSGVSSRDIGEILNFKKSPRKKDNTWRTRSIAISNALGMEPGELFPDHLNHEVLTNRVSSLIERDQLEGILDSEMTPVDAHEQAELAQTIDDAIDSLPGRDGMVLRALFWEEVDHQEVARRLKITRSAVCELARRALQKMRHPVRAKQLEIVCPFELRPAKRVKPNTKDDTILSNRDHDNSKWSAEYIERLDATKKGVAS